MNGIAAKIAQEVAVFFQYQHFNAGARQQIAEHHASRTASGNAAADDNGLTRHGFSSERLATERQPHFFFHRKREISSATRWRYSTPGASTRAPYYPLRIAFRRGAPLP
jgi:hypothetical protein